MASCSQSLGVGFYAVEMPHALAASIHTRLYELPKQLERTQLNDLGHFHCSTSSCLDWDKNPESGKFSVSFKNFISHLPKYEIASRTCVFSCKFVPKCLREPRDLLTNCRDFFWWKKKGKKKNEWMKERKKERKEEWNEEREKAVIYCSSLIGEVQ